MAIAVWIRATLADGQVFEGPIHGCGGYVGGGAMHAGYERASQAALRDLTRAQRRVSAGLSPGLFEPIPEHIVIYPEFSAREDGPRVAIPVIGTKFEVVPEGGEGRG